MSEVLFTIITASAALTLTLMWLSAVIYFSMKYFEYRMKEKLKGGDEAGSAKDSI